MNVTTPQQFAKAKADLLALGIDLDDDLIQRLQLNLGIERIFSVARKAANLMKEKPHSSSGVHQGVIYRHVSGSGQPHGSSLSPFKRDAHLHLDSKHSASILKDLTNRDSIVEPQHRPAVDKLLEAFSVLYARSPDRFVACLLGRKYTPDKDKSASHSVAGHAMSKLVLKSRYVNEEDFAVMVRRVDRAALPAHVTALFGLLVEDRHFAHNRRAVVDLWGFLTLLKTASEQTRRSFDSRTSKLATQVEFWHRSNPSRDNASHSLASTRADLGMGGGGGGGGGGMGSGMGVGRSFSTSEAGWMGTSQSDHCVFAGSESLGRERNRRFNSAMNMKVVGRDQAATTGSTRPTGATEGGSSSHRPGHRLPLQAHQSVAQLLGSHEHRHMNKSSGGRDVMGRFHLEFANKCDVPAALHSPLKSARSSHSPARTRPSTARIDTDIGRGRGSFALSGSDQVGAALGYLGGAQSRARSAVRPRTSTDTVDRLAEERRGIFGERDYDASEGTTAGALARAASTGRGVRPFSSQHTLSREQTDRSSVAAVLGCAREDGSFPGKGARFGDPASFSAALADRLSRKNSYGTLNRDNRSSSVSQCMTNESGAPPPPAPHAHETAPPPPPAPTPAPPAPVEG